MWEWEGGGEERGEGGINQQCTHLDSGEGELSVPSGSGAAPRYNRVAA